MQEVDATRRGMIGLTALAVVFPRLTFGTDRSLRFNTVGQALILRTFDGASHPGFGAIQEELAGADVCFTNLETALNNEAPSTTTPLPVEDTYKVGAPVAVLATLRQLHFNLLSLANNHSDDLGELGFLETIAAVSRHGFGYAGTGRNLAEAAAPGYLDNPAGKVALVAMASNAVPPEAMATVSRPGVNHVAKKAGEPLPEDARRVHEAIALAARNADHVVAYHHDHYWHPDWQVTPEWKKRWARSCIDAGANVFVGQGVPIVHGIEIYRGRPIFYGLGNFVFHLTYHLERIAETFASIGNEGYVDPRVWQSVVAKCEFLGGRVHKLRLYPITLAAQRRVVRNGTEPTGNPAPARGAEAAEILQRMQRLSATFGTKVRIRANFAEVSF